MIKIYNTNIENNKTLEIKEYKRGSWINIIAPTDTEIKKVCEEIKIKEDFVRYSLDLEEQARIDIEDEDNTILFIIDVPITERDKISNKEEYTTMPIGIIMVRDDYIITVANRRTPTLDEIEANNSKD